MQDHRKVLPFAAAENWISKLVGALSKTRRTRSATLAQIGDTFGDPLLLARYYVRPLCQHNNPATEDRDIDAVVCSDAFATLEAFFARCDTAVNSDGRRHMFVLADAGMGKTSLLVMLRLAHLCAFWPPGYKCELLKLGIETATDIGKLKDHANTILLLDSLDEDAASIGRIHDRISELLVLTSKFYAVVVTCRTQYFPIGETDPVERLGSISVVGYRCPVIYLSPFTNGQVNQYLSKRFPRSIWRWLRRKESPQHIAAQKVLNKTMTLHLRPMLLAYVDDLVEKDSGRELTAYEAFEILVDAWLEREVRRGQVESKQDLYASCMAVAHRLDKLGQRALSHEEFVAACVEEPNVRNIGLIDVGGRALLNMTSAGAFRFAHFALQEFILAKEIVERTIYATVDATKNEISILPIKHERSSVRGTSELIRFVVEGVRVGYSKAIYRDIVVALGKRMSIPPFLEAGHMLPVANIEFRQGNFSRLDLSGICFDTCSFQEAVFTHAALQRCRFGSCDMRNADFSRADFYEAELSDVDLCGANLTGANLCGAKLQTANLQEACANGATVIHALYDQHTRWPDGFDYDALGAIVRPHEIDENPLPSSKLRKTD